MTTAMQQKNRRGNHAAVARTLALNKGVTGHDPNGHVRGPHSLSQSRRNQRPAVKLFCCDQTAVK